MSKSHANVVSSNESLSNLLTSMNLHQHNEKLFTNETAIEATGETLVQLYSIVDSFFIIQ